MIDAPVSLAAPRAAARFASDSSLVVTPEPGAPSSAGAWTDAAPLPALEARLERVHLGSLLQLAEAEAISGYFQLDGGVVELASGNVVAARTATGLEGVAALRELLLATDGRTLLVLDPGIRGSSLGRTIGFVMDSVQQLDEWEEIAPASWRAPGPLPALQDEAQRALLEALLADMSGGRALGEVVARRRADRVRVLDLMRPLVASGHVTPARPLAGARVERLDERADGPATTPAAPPAHGPASPSRGEDVGALVERARAQAREGALEDAAGLLERVLALRPDDRVVAQNLRHIQAKLARR
jgi:hypothetical protein